MPVTPGQILRGKYSVLASIGRGGMGEVFSARRLSDHLPAAIKVVSRVVVDETLMARLEREAIAARRIKSDFVPELYEVDRTDEGELFLVMRLLEGVPLSQRMRERAVLSWPEVYAIVDDVLSGLADAHAAGVVHRDLKPANVFLERVEAPTIPSSQRLLDLADGPVATSREQARILDFGVCKLDASDTEKLTQTGEAVGTVSYMAPEQIRGASEVDGRADLYAVATLAFEAVTGRLPFTAEGQMALLAAKLERKPKHVRELARVAIPAGLDSLLDKALGRKPEERFGSALEMRKAWRALGPAEIPAANNLPIVTQTGVSHPTETGLTAHTGTRVGATSRVGLALAAGAVVVAALAIVLTLQRASRSAAPPAAAVATSASPAPPTSAEAPPPATLTVPTFELGADPPQKDAGSALSAKASKPAGFSLGKPRSAGTGTVKPQGSAQGPHIATVPRY